MFMNSSNQIEFISVEQLVPQEHNYRVYLNILDFETLIKPMSKLEYRLGAKGYGILCLFKCLLLQFLEDVSDRELQKLIAENIAAKYFCGFSLTDKTPDFTLFTKVRKRIGTTLLSEVFALVRNSLKEKGYMSEVFSFVDASHLITKNSLWEERDKAIEAKYEKLNNETLGKVAVDKEAKIGCKGRQKYWYGYKKNVCVDMQSGLINKVAITAANVADAKALKHICPSGGVVFGDKGYCTVDAQRELKRKGCSDATIKRNNMRNKDYGRDSWRSKMRFPHERVFSKSNHMVRYKGLVKNQFALFMESLAYNMKRLSNMGVRCRVV
ncbi:MAG: transposase [Spirochaetota bacterium]